MAYHEAQPMAPSDFPSTDQTQSTTPAKPAVEARQGVISGRVVTVLAVSSALAVLALVIAYLIFGHY
jgi:hypothetical protein